jgi:hypothetical protein
MIVAILFYGLPFFTGNFFFQKITIDLPTPYKEIMTYFNTQPDGRIADFPQDCPEGWYGYKWGYFGSGFLWYGIKQPFLSRPFDIWNQSNENYFWEVTAAIRQKDFQRVDTILEKYDVTWIIYDPNFIHCRSAKGLFANYDLYNHLSHSPLYSVEKVFSDNNIEPISLFKRTQQESYSYIQIRNNIQNVGPLYKVNSDDRAFRNDYYVTNPNISFDTFYPFHSLMTNKTNEDKETIIKNDREHINLSSLLPHSLKGYTITVPSIFTIEKHIPVSIKIVQTSPRTAVLEIAYTTPEILLDGVPLTIHPVITKSEEFQIDESTPLSLFVNNANIQPDQQGIYKSLFTLNNGNTISLAQNQIIEFEWHDTLFQQEQKNTPLQKIVLPQFTTGLLEIRIPKLTIEPIVGQIYTDIASLTTPISCGQIGSDIRNKYELGQQNMNQYIRLISQDSQQCFTVTLPQISTNLGYIVETSTRNIEGSPLKLHITSKEKPIGLDLYLSKHRQVYSDIFIIPPSVANEISYEVTFENTSFSNKQSINEIYSVALWNIPYEYLKQIYITKPSLLQNNEIINVFSKQFQLGTVNHPNETMYLFTNEQSIQPNTYIILNQGFHSGWKAYTIQNNSISKLFPFLFGKRLDNHVLINNWANGWEIHTSDSNKTVIIFFVPQLIQWFGFLLLLFPFVSILVWKKNNI